MTDNVFDVIVVGSGIEGSATAYYLTTNHTKNVLVLEQFSSMNERGSSHGGSRITEMSFNRPHMDKFAPEAYKMWSDIEKISHQQIYKKTGKVVIGESSKIMEYYEYARHVASCTFMTSKETNEKYSKQLNVPDDHTCVLEEDGGFLKANVALATLQSLYTANGGQLLDHHKVINIIPGSAVIEVITDKGTFFGTRIIITAGCWTNRVLKYTELQLPLQILKAESLYCPVNDPLLFMPDAFPVFTYYDSADSIFSGVPINEHDGLLKIIAHSGSEMDNPDYRDTVSLQTNEVVGLFVTKHLRGVKPQPTVIEPCMYSVTPDKYPVLDRHPTHRNIVIGAGFSGYGFKFAPVVGKILSELAFDIQTSHDITPFAISRFDSTDNRTDWTL